MKNLLAHRYTFYSDIVRKVLWPRDAPGYNFLGRFVDDVGTALYGDVWTRRDPEVDYPAILISEDTGMRNDNSEDGWVERAQAALLLGRIELDGEDRDPSEVVDGQMVLEKILEGDEDWSETLTFTEDEWRQAVELCIAQISRAVERHQRFLAVQELIAAAAARDEIEIAYRCPQSGKLIPTPAEWWLSKIVINRFVECRINPDEPLSEASAEWSTGAELFVDVNGSERLIKRLGAAKKISKADPEVFIKNVFWAPSSREGWPADGEKHVFLGRAILELGRVAFPREWRDEGAGYEIPRELPPAPEPIGNVIEEFLAEQKHGRLVAAFRATQVLTMLMDAARSGKLKIFTSPHLRREYNPCPREWWVGSKWNHLLGRCTIDRENPQSEHPNARPAELLFVDRGSLERLVAAVSTGTSVLSFPLLADEAVLNQNVRKPNARTTALTIYCDRLKRRVTARQQKVEAGHIGQAWNGGVQQPTDRRIGEYLAGLHNQLRWNGDKVDASSADELAVRIQDGIGIA